MLAIPRRTEHLRTCAPAVHRPEADTPAATSRTRPATLSDRERVIQALNRLTFGPRPGDVDAVMAKGMDAWIEDQLHPESIDDSALNARLGPYATTRMNPKQLAQTFPSDTVIRQIIAGKRTMPDDPESTLVYSVNVARIKQQEAVKAQTANGDATPAVKMSAPTAADNAAKPASPSPAEVQARAIADTLLALPKNQRLAALENAPCRAADQFPESVTRGPARPSDGRFLAAGAGDCSRARKSGGRCRLRTSTSKVGPRDLFRTAIARSDDRFLVQPFQCFPVQEPVCLLHDRVRARCNSSARPGQVLRFARRHRTKSGHVDVSR